MGYRLSQIKRCARALSRSNGKEARRVVFFCIFLPFFLFLLPVFFWKIAFFRWITLLFASLQGTFLLFFCHPLWMGVRRWFLERAGEAPLRKSGIFYFFTKPSLYFKAVFARIWMALLRFAAGFLCSLAAAPAFSVARKAAAFGGAVQTLSPLCFLAAAGLFLCGCAFAYLFCRRFRLFYWLMSHSPQENLFRLFFRSAQLWHQAGPEAVRVRRWIFGIRNMLFFRALWLNGLVSSLPESSRSHFVPFRPKKRKVLKKFTNIHRNCLFPPLQ